MARERSVASARNHERPFAPWPEDFDNPERFCRSIPYLGDREHIRSAYGPPMWVRSYVDRFLLNYPYNWFFVDSSGWSGGEDGPALTPSKFVEMVREYSKAAHSAGFEVGFGIVEAGHFQVHIAHYLRRLYRKEDR